MSNGLYKYRKLVDSINVAYSTLHNLSNDELRIKVSEIEKDINTSANKTKALNNCLVTVYAIVKETARRLSEGNIIVTASDNDFKLAEMYDFVEII